MLLRTQALALVTLVCLSSCISRQYVPGTVSTISLSSEVRLPQRMIFETPGSRMMALAGAGLGSGYAMGVASGMGSSARLDMREWYRQEILKALQEEISARRQFRLVPEGQGEATLHVSTALWGFMLKGAGFSSEPRSLPGTPLTVEMKNPQGKLLWKASGPGFRGISQDPGHPVADLRDNPKLMRQILAASLRQAARDIAATLPMGTAAVHGTR